MDDDTTIRIYVKERDWLQRRQRRAGAERDKWPTMADVIRELIESVIEREERGNDE